jgi:pimeloyl-ACP methyl ester carboxylesterase
MDIETDDVILIGRSLGGGVAVALAAEQGAAALILEGTFPTMFETAANLYPWLPVSWCMDNQYDSRSRIRQYHGPLLQCHGALDTLIPIQMARQLFDDSPSRVKRWIAFPDLDHNSEWPPKYYSTLAAFLDPITLP